MIEARTGTRAAADRLCVSRGGSQGVTDEIKRKGHNHDLMKGTAL